MKIAVIGYSGSGKSTLTRKLGEQNDLPVLHLDSVHWMPGWQERPREDSRRIVGDFLDAHDRWIIDGTYSKLHFERRLEEADCIILMQFSALNCLWRVWKRYLKGRGRSRPDMGEGCPEKVDGEFVRWILWNGRTKKHRIRFRSIREQHPEKVVWIRNQRQLDHYEKECGLCSK